MLDYIDLFAGLGGFSVGLKDLGNCHFAAENEPIARSQYALNFPAHTLHSDVTKIVELPKLDLLCGGFPCQSFSSAGRQKGFDDPRGQLIFQILRLVDSNKPRWLLLENVKNLLHIDDGKTFETILDEIKKRGYKVSYKVCNSINFGVPQLRERVFILAGPKQIEIPDGNGKPRRTIKHILQKNVTDHHFHRCYRLPDSIEKTTGRIPVVNDQGKLHQDDYLIRSNEPSPTLAASCFGATYGRKVIYPEMRYLTSREVARIQGFPQWYKLHSNRKENYRLFGNAVVPPIVAEIAGRLI
ncbi:DNA cytosine methyltransferase [Rubinisphaera italica]|uniref:Cytosine-specific methyltransferase n=1 Tax=Rubinisphaera italica TaxID=2527969 RepID=A0A5C5XRA3_9PLAN|nr:DNA cytosine methyltransferase [Rubinisphaera italica]TWT64252.1 Modification methylase HhaI [Rubinisphaera italica]